MKYKLFKQYGDQPEIKASCAGDKFQKVFKYVVNKQTGEEEYICTGKLDFNSIIQSAKPGCDLEYIINHILKGDNSVLMAKNGVYADVTQLPTNIIEAGEMEEKIMKVYQDNDLLRKVYPTFNSYRADFLKHEDIEKKVVDYVKNEVNSLQLKKLQEEKAKNVEVK